MHEVQKVTLKNIGADVCSGSFDRHSIFSRVGNYISGTRLVSLVTERIGAGPVNIVFSGDHVPAPLKIHITTEHLFLGRRGISLQNVDRYDPALQIPEIKMHVVRENAALMAKPLSAFAPRNSLAVLLDMPSNPEVSCCHGMQIIHRVQSAVENIRRGNIPEGIRTLSGVGFGLTPSGDDFLTGMVWGINLMERNREYTRLKQYIRSISSSENPLVRSQMDAAVNGRYSAGVKALLSALISGVETEICAQTLRLLNMGHTSGADAATGLLLCLGYDATFSKRIAEMTDSVFQGVFYGH